MMNDELKEPEFGGSTPLFMVHQNDLETLERDLPLLLREMGLALNHKRNQVRWRRVIEIIRNIRWDYGPPTEVEEIPAGPDE